MARLTSCLRAKAAKCIMLTYRVAQKVTNSRIIVDLTIGDLFKVTTVSQFAV